MVYEQVAEAYIAGLEDFSRAGGDVSSIASVASFFVSRIDTASRQAARRSSADRQAGAIGLRGKVAIANAKIAYARYKALFSGPRWQALAASGAQAAAPALGLHQHQEPRLQGHALCRGADRPRHGQHHAARDDGRLPRPRRSERPTPSSRTSPAPREALAELERAWRLARRDHRRAGRGRRAAVRRRVRQAVRAPWRSSAARCSKASAPRLEIRPGSAGNDGAAFEQEMEALAQGGPHSAALGRATNRCGRGPTRTNGSAGCTSSSRNWPISARCRLCREMIRQRGFTDVVLLGMGGSSLGPEVLAETFGPQSGWPRFHMLDSTDPAQIKAIETGGRSRQDAVHRLLQIRQHAGAQYLHGLFPRARRRDGVGKDKAGAHFIAVTDPGSSLERRAKQLAFRAGLLWRAVDRRALFRAVEIRHWCRPRRWVSTSGDCWRRARTMERACGPDVPPAENPGVQLGVALGVAGDALRPRQGDDHRLAGDRRSRRLAGAASGGEHGQAGARADPAGRRAAGRAASAMATTGSSPISSWSGAGDPAQRDGGRRRWKKAGHPVARIRVKDIWHIGQEFFRWEIATAVAGAIIGIDPFDQPDVEASKDKTSELTEAYEKIASPACRGAGVSRERPGALRRSAQRRRAWPAQHARAAI